MSKRNHPEDALQRSIVTWLRRQHPQLLFFHTPNGGKRSRTEAARMKGLGVLAGVSDLTVLWAGGQSGFIELKAGKGRLTDTQKCFRDRLTELGHRHAVSRSLEDVQETLKQWGAI